MSERHDAPPRSPDITIVTAVRNAARHLEAFIESIDQQTAPAHRIEVIAVDDASTDGSLSILEKWQQRRAGVVTVITTDAVGRAAARNAGMELARGAWITFPEPDDILDRHYLREVLSFVETHETPHLIATRLLVIGAASGLLEDRHPLRGRFHHGNRLRNINHYPDHFHESAHNAFYPVAELRRQRRRFDDGVGAGFEDAHFCSHYLLAFDEPVIGYVPAARYHSRERSDPGVAHQVVASDSRRYAHVLREGFLNVLRPAAERTGTGLAPEWLQNLVLYELSWYFTSRDADVGAVQGMAGSDADDVHAALSELLGYLSRDTIAAFSARPMRPEWKDILLHGYEGNPWRQRIGHVSRFDRHQDLVKIAYRYTGDPPAEELLSGGEVVPAKHAKTRNVVYHGRILMRERVVWLSSRQSVRLRVDGSYLDLQFAVPQPTHTLQPGQIQRRLDPRHAAAQQAQTAHRRSFWNRLLFRFARTRLVRRFFGDAWVLMDRITDSGDNAEHLFRYLRRSRPRVNAWFVVEGGSPDWRRLRAEGYRRVIPHGSLRWKLLMANCRHLISSHISGTVIRPPELQPLMEPRWRFTFLQHGVIHTNLSRWLNPKPIDLFITSSTHEYLSIAADHTPYTFTTKEVRLTGLPRWDRLSELASRTSDDARDLVLVTPTWRSGLVPLLLPRSRRRAIDDDFFESDYARNWISLLKSDRLAEACDREGLTLGFLPHPNVQPALPAMQLPAHVRALTFAENDVQELFARSAVLVTDYSSVAFDAAYIHRPVVYFQFDRDKFLGGEHHGRRGYYDYDRDGFGPVAHTLDDAIAGIISTITTGRDPAPVYRARIAATFPLRDGQCCERVVNEISSSTRRLSPAEAAVATPTPVMAIRTPAG